MELVTGLLIAFIGLGAALQMVRRKNRSRSYVIRSLGLVLLVYTIAGVVLWFLFRI